MRQVHSGVTPEAEALEKRIHPHVDHVSRACAIMRRYLTAEVPHERSTSYFIARYYYNNSYSAVYEYRGIRILGHQYHARGSYYSLLYRYSSTGINNFNFKIDIYGCTLKYYFKTLREHVVFILK